MAEAATTFAFSPATAEPVGAIAKGLGTIKIPLPKIPNIQCRQSLHDWLVYQGLHSNDPMAMFVGTVEGLRKTGVRLARAHYTLPTLHPLYRAVGTTWYPEEPVEIEHYSHRVDVAQAWTDSPLRPLVEGDHPEAYYRMKRGEGLEFPLIRRLHDEGYTGWFGARIAFGNDEGSAGLPGAITSWATKRRGGFTRRELARIRAVLPRFGLAIYRMSLMQVASNLMSAYVGQEAGGRILSGNILRGQAEHMRAAILLADLRSFTRFANEHSGTEVLELLNDYHTAVSDAVEANGGEVFKFVGDGLLAVFQMAESDGPAAGKAALKAAKAARAAVCDVIAERQAAGKPTLDMDLALHAGEVEYGNVGSHSRLDFTVIGPAVNEASRMEQLCEPNNVDLVMSRAFAELAGARARHLGDFELRGFDGARPIFTLNDDNDGVTVSGAAATA